MTTDSNDHPDQHDRTDHNDQRLNHVHGGEYRNGRLSQIKNHNPTGDTVPNEYIDHER